MAEAASRAGGLLGMRETEADGSGRQHLGLISIDGGSHAAAQWQHVPAAGSRSWGLSGMRQTEADGSGRQHITGLIRHVKLILTQNLAQGSSQPA